MKFDSSYGSSSSIASITEGKGTAVKVVDQSSTSTTASTKNLKEKEKELKLKVNSWSIGDNKFLLGMIWGCLLTLIGMEIVRGRNW